MTTHRRTRVWAIAAAIGLLLTGVSSLDKASADPLPTPIGSFDSLSQAPGWGVHFSGWAIDRSNPTSFAPATIAVSINSAHVTGVGISQTSPNGQVIQNFSATTYRPDVGSAFPGVGNQHGFDATVHIDPRTPPVTVCVAILAAGGPSVSLGCRSFSFATGMVGAVDSVTPVVGGLRIQGWDIALDADKSNGVDIFVDGRGWRRFTENVTRADVHAAFPGYSADVGFDIIVPLQELKNTKICAIAAETPPYAARGVESHWPLGCGSATVEDNGNPFGSLDQVQATAPGRVQVQGWAIDASTTASLTIVYMVDNAEFLRVTENVDRLDVDDAFPDFSDSPHGFDDTLNLSAGAHNVCAVAANVGYGVSVNLGCQDVTVS